MRKGLKIGIVIVAVIVALGLSVGLPLYFVLRPKNSQTQTFPKAAVASASPTCSKIGKNILLNEDGNAADAAVAVAVCLGVVEFQSSGLGGGGFLLFYDKQSKESIAIDFRSSAPVATGPSSLDNHDQLTTPGLFVAVPGELSGLYRLWKTQGSLPWYKLFQPSIALAEDGFEVSKNLSSAAAEVDQSVFENKKFELLKNLLKPNGKILKVGDKIKRPKLAETLRYISENDNSLSTIYGSDIRASPLASEIQNFGGLMSAQDLSMYSAIIRYEVQVSSLPNNGRLLAAPLPSSGVVQHFIKNIMFQYYELNELDKPDLKFYHRIVEAFKFAFGRRNVLSDDGSFSTNGQGAKLLAESLVNDDYAKKIRVRIDEKRGVQSSQSVYYNDPDITGYAEYPDSDKEDVKRGGTTHIAIVDSSGNAVSLTTSIGEKFGSKIVSEKTGILLNNDMIGFSYLNSDKNFGLPINKRNRPEGNKRPMSSMSPMIAINQNSDVSLVIGGAGGSRIITSVSLAMIRYFFLSIGLKNAVNDPMIHHQLSPYFLYPEKGFDEGILRGLEDLELLANPGANTIARGYLRSKKPFAIYAIGRNPSGSLTAVCDSRDSGIPAGY